MTETPAADLRSRERWRLTQEVSTAVTELLASVTTTVMGAEGEADPGRLQELLRRIGLAADAALADLRLLDRLVRDASDPVTPAAGDPGALADADSPLARPATAGRGNDGRGAAGLTTVAPTAAGQGWEARLVDAGLVVSVEVPLTADHLERSTASTVVRVLDVGAGLALTRALPGSTFTATVSVLDDAVLVVVDLRPPPSGPDPDVDQDLEALRARLDLSGGTLSAGARSVRATRSWVLAATFPRGRPSRDPDDVSRPA